MRMIALAATALVLSSCSSMEPAAAEDTASEAGSNELENASAAQPGAPANEAVSPIPPPDAVSHPDGFLPPAPAEPEPPTANSSDPGSSQRATEHENIRNGQ